MLAIQCQNLAQAYKGHFIFSNINVTVSWGEKIGLVGLNGSGKSTLLKVLAQGNGTAGDIVINGSLAYLAQREEEEGQSAGEAIRHRLRLLLAGPEDILLLDEPSANLDFKQQEWLLSYLKRTKKTLIIASHDEALLETIPTSIWALDEGQLTVYPGNYAAYKKALGVERMQQEKAYRNYQEEKRALKEAIQKKKAQAEGLTTMPKNGNRSEWKVNSFMGSYDGQERRLAKSAQAMAKRLKRLKKVEPPIKVKTLQFRSVGRVLADQRTLIHLADDFLVQRAGKLIFRGQNFHWRAGERFALQGGNGTGKTTFLHALAEERLPGYYAPDLRWGVFDQNLRQLKPEKSLMSQLEEESLQPPQVIQQLLMLLALSPDKWQRPFAHLSGGEQMKGQMAALLLGDYDALLLDEPTNYLDQNALEALTRFIKAYPGSILLVSHAERFLQKLDLPTYRIKNQQLLAPDVVVEAQTQREKELQLLSFRRDNLLQDSNASLTELADLDQKIQKLREQIVSRS